MSTDPKTIAATYFEAWEAADVERLRGILAEGVSFHGPLAQVHGADAYAESIRGLFEATEKVVVHKVWVDGEDVLTWFDLHMPGAPSTPVAQWCHVCDGKVDRVQVTFDPRGILVIVNKASPVHLATGLAIGPALTAHLPALAHRLAIRHR